MTNPLLVPLLREAQFWAAVLVGLPLLVFGYVEAADAILHGGELDEVALLASLSANPITLYLAARQFPRGKSVEAIGIERAADPAAARELDGLELDDEDAEAELAAEVDGALA